MSTITAKKSKTPKPATARWQNVQFEVTAAEARTVCIAGTFNDWHPDVSPMIPLGNGCWAKNLLLSPGTYEYCLVVDGEWRPDPQASKTIANPFGGLNSVLQVVAPMSWESSFKDRHQFGASA